MRPMLTAARTAAGAWKNQWTQPVAALSRHARFRRCIAFRRRSVGHLEQVSGEADEILQPQRLEPQLRAKLMQLGGHGVVEEIVAGDNRHGRRTLLVP